MKKLKGVLKALIHELFTNHKLYTKEYSGPENKYHAQLTEIGCQNCKKIFYKKEN